MNDSFLLKPYDTLVWAVRHKPTGFWLGGHAHYSNTWCEPYASNRPRLFFTKRGAQNSLTAWLQGRQSIEYGTRMDWQGKDDFAKRKIEHVPERKREDMEIVELQLTEIL